jgi:Mn2+/Fe2+ NRAMP family transporter
MQVSYDSDKRKLLSSLCHGAIFFSTGLLSIGVPIVINSISDDPVVKSNAKESINFHFNVWFWATLIGIPIAIISFITFGIGGILFFPVVALGFAIHWGLTIWALFHCLTQPDEPFRYPFIFRVF